VISNPFAVGTWKPLVNASNATSGSDVRVAMSASSVKKAVPGMSGRSCSATV
jgi:hypothetical protein